MSIIKLVLMRHGSSIWNDQDRFTGWTDIDLSEKGKNEVKYAGKMLKSFGYSFNFAYTSLLKRAIHSLWVILKEINQSWIPVEKSWRLNERHYGALQGFSKYEIEKKYGKNQLNEWRRGFSISPPKINEKDNYFILNDKRYLNLKTKKLLPFSESLKSTIDRIMPYWDGNIFPRLQNKEKIIIVAHGNSIRAIIKILCNLNEKEIIKINIPTGIPLIYEFDYNMVFKKKYFLFDR
ncbi:gpmA [Wigglesworthia glossinidia endosymbiont of Glossina brevipalpis]|uniref:2,3-bisphosphoglycerate-dependent phosphoglycerate mutase n=1 Tax=Wigglesworthia glossinidia brevipalpis TaxID=36870 RepID=GPMA_WIGBR|nr:RecName: Full=2,3-bisphosphoglycerate-dependent phosphoglycerate mutase; Short=BPG-dependent PGAM; Short=PGAM; Short=Phosphoglyceromutase; Short=dPGM [Wigglesworthia glossinidia endosymbiont of Glossina brevipalpis]BAC24364.1 gpmA [Wigglesworthia glossinidia endosymbiont of Glossina brevipalpis]